MIEVKTDWQNDNQIYYDFHVQPIRGEPLNEDLGDFINPDNVFRGEQISIIDVMNKS